MNVVPYTAIFGGRDPLRADIQCFTEKDFHKFVTPCMDAKIFKVLSHMFIEADISIWMDGYVHPKVPVQNLVELLGDADMFIFRHPWNNSRGILHEVKVLKTARPKQIKLVSEQANHYIRKGLNAGCDMMWGGFLIRRHNEAVMDFNRKWWAEICRWSERDQIALPWIVKNCPGLNLRVGSYDVTKYTLDVKWHSKGC